MVGGNSEVYDEENHTLYAGRSFSNDYREATLSYYWSCFDKDTQKSCFEGTKVGDSLELNKESLKECH